MATKTQTKRPTGDIVYDDAAQERAREAFEASVRAMTSGQKPLAALGQLDDLEMMEAATTLTRQK